MGDIPLVNAVLHAIEILTFVGGAAAVVWKGGRVAERFESGLQVQGAKIAELNDTVRGMGVTLAQVAVQDQRLDTHDKRLDSLTAYIDEMRRGEGFIVSREPRQVR